MTPAWIDSRGGNAAAAPSGTLPRTGVERAIPRASSGWSAVPGGAAPGPNPEDVR